MQGSREVQKIRKGQRKNYQEGGYEEKEYEKKYTKTNKPKRGNESDKEDYE